MNTPPETGGQNNDWHRGARVVLITAATFIVIAGLKLAAPIVNYFLISLLLALISATPVFWLQRKSVPIVLGVVLVSVSVIAVLTFTAFMLVGSLSAFSARLPEYQIRLQENLAPLQTWLQSKGIALSGPTLFPDLDPRNALGLVMRLLGDIGGLLSNLLLILLTVIFLLLDTAGFQNRLHRLSPDPTVSLQRYGKVAAKIRHYLVLKTWLSLATGVCAGVWVALLGLDFPMIWAMLAFFFNFIPTVGSILAAIPAILLALIQLGVWPALLVALGYVVINIVIGNLLEPRIMGRGVGVPGSVVFLAMIFWGWVLGPVGMILSVPLTVIVIIALDSGADTRWLATLLSSDGARDAAG